MIANEHSKKKEDKGLNRRSRNSPKDKEPWELSSKTRIPPSSRTSIGFPVLTVDDSFHRVRRWREKIDMYFEHGISIIIWIANYMVVRKMIEAFCASPDSR